MALLPQQPKQQRALLFSILGLAAAGLFWNYWETPEREEISTVTERVESLEAQNQAARIAAARGEEGLQENLATFERHIARLEQLVPSEQDVSELITDLNLTANRLDILGIDWIRNPEQPGPNYNLQTFDSNWVGEYHDVGRFLSEIANFERILTPIQLQLTVPQNPEDYAGYEAPVEAAFTLATYVLPQPGQAMPMDSTSMEGGE